MVEKMQKRKALSKWLNLLNVDEAICLLVEGPLTFLWVIQIDDSGWLLRAQLIHLPTDLTYSGLRTVMELSTDVKRVRSYDGMTILDSVLKQLLNNNVQIESPKTFSTKKVFQWFGSFKMYEQYQLSLSFKWLP